MRKIDIKFKLEPKVGPPAMEEAARVMQEAEKTKREVLSIEELLFGKEIKLNDLITD